MLLCQNNMTALIVCGSLYERCLIVVVCAWQFVKATTQLSSNWNGYVKMGELFQKDLLNWLFRDELKHFSFKEVVSKWKASC